jgi:hypothetical protein
MRWMFFSVVLGAHLLVGCKSDCEVVCERGQECPAASELFRALDCDDACDLSEDLADNLGCGDEFDDFYACGAAHEDEVCTSGTECSAEAQRFNACFRAFQP